MMKIKCEYCCIFKNEDEFYKNDLSKCKKCMVKEIKEGNIKKKRIIVQEKIC